MGKMGVYIDVPKKAFDGLEHVNDCIITGFYALGRLIHMYVTRIGTEEVKKATYNK